MESAFLLAGDDTMTVRDLFGVPAGPARLGVLALAQTGVAGGSLPDEALGLPTALLAVGVTGVIASAWAIPEQYVVVSRADGNAILLRYSPRRRDHARHAGR